MTTYYVDDGGSNTAPYDTWAKASPSLQELMAAVALANNDIIYVGSDSVDGYTDSANFTFDTVSGGYVQIISANTGTSAYEASSSNQIDTSEGAYVVDTSGAAYSIYGLRIKSGSDIRTISSYNAVFDSCTFLPAAGKQILGGGNERAYQILRNCTIDLVADTSAQTATVTGAYSGLEGNYCKIEGCTFLNATNRTGAVIGPLAYYTDVVGCDFSGFTNATACEIVGFSNVPGIVYVHHCKTAATWSPYTGEPREGAELLMTNVGPSDAPTYLVHRQFTGGILSSTSISRTGGAAIEGTAISWLVTTQNWFGAFAAFETRAYRTPYIYGVISSAGSKTFDLYITNDTADLTNKECWLEIEYSATSGSPTWTLARDFISSITATPANQDDDSTSEWNGTGPSFTYKQKLSVTATVNEPGLFRARVCVLKDNVTSASYFYIDPKVTVS